MNNNIKTEVPEGYVLLQRHEGKPLYAACLDGGRWHGWLFKKGPEAGQWVSERKLEQWEVMQAEDQRDDGIVHETSGAHATQAVARYAGVDCGRYTIEWTNGPLPEGTEFFAAPLATPADAGATPIPPSTEPGPLNTLLQIAEFLGNSCNIQQTGVDTWDYPTQFDYELGQAASTIRTIAAELEVACKSSSAAPVTASQPAAQVPSIKAWHERTDECTPTATVLAMESEIADLRAALKGQPAAAYAAKEGGQQ